MSWGEQTKRWDDLYPSDARYWLWVWPRHWHHWQLHYTHHQGRGNENREPDIIIVLSRRNLRYKYKDLTKDQWLRSLQINTNMEFKFRQFRKMMKLFEEIDGALVCLTLGQDGWLNETWKVPERCQAYHSMAMLDFLWMMMLLSSDFVFRFTWEFVQYPAFVS